MNAMNDWRNIKHGWEIPSETYCDQPYVVKTDDGAWLCVVTTGQGREGQSGQHVLTLRSLDMGQTWSVPVDVEPSEGPEASYAVLLKIPQGYPAAGRVYCFYNHNSDHVREVIADDPPFNGGRCTRVDSLGHFVFKFSDDHGRSWSEGRYDIPMRNFAIDNENVYGGKLRFFWNVGKPFIHAGAAYVAVHKVGGFGEGFFTRSEGVLLKSENLLTETDPTQITWETLPDGDVGLRAPQGGGPIAEEQSTVVLSDGALYCVYRTIDGHPAFTYSRDGGHTWASPQYKSYADGRLMKHPRAANFVWKCESGKYLYWFHNHGGRFILEHPQRRSIAYNDRNPVWLCGGLEVDAPEGKIIHWSQPELVLYDDDPLVRISYPDLVEDDGRYFLTETQKDVARVHEISRDVLDGLWRQFDNRTLTTDGLVLSLSGRDAPMLAEVPMPDVPAFVERDSQRADYGSRDLRAGFSLDLWVRFKSLEVGQVLLDNRTAEGRGFCLRTTVRGTVALVLNDGRTENRWECDPGMLTTERDHHIVAIVDGGPKIISFIVDGAFNDGGAHRQFGWGRYNPNLRGVDGADILRIAPRLDGELKALRVYNRYLRTSEAIANYHAGVD